MDVVVHVCVYVRMYVCTYAYLKARYIPACKACKAHVMAQCRVGPRHTCWSSAAKPYVRGAAQEDFSSSEQPAEQWSKGSLPTLLALK